MRSWWILLAPAMALGAWGCSSSDDGDRPIEDGTPSLPLDEETDQPDSGTDPTDGGTDQQGAGPAPPPEGLERLLGTIDFFSQRSTSSDIVRDRMIFESLGDDTLDDGQPMLFKRTETSNDLCFEREGADRFQCQRYFIADGARLAFFFTLGSDGLGDGNYEYCSGELTLDECNAELDNGRDGTLRVRVHSLANAGLNVSAGAGEIVSVDSHAYHFVQEQAEP